MNEVRVRLRIGSLDLDLPDDLPTGLPAGQARRLLADLQTELARRFETGGLPPGMNAGARLDTIRVQAPGHRRGGPRAHQRLAERIAGAVYEGLAQ